MGPQIGQQYSDLWDRKKDPNEEWWLGIEEATLQRGVACQGQKLCCPVCISN